VDLKVLLSGVKIDTELSGLGVIVASNSFLTPRKLLSKRKSTLISLLNGYQLVILLDPSLV
jgi:hypothetical protein